MNAYIINGFRTAVGKAPKGKLRFTRPDDMAVEVVKHFMTSIPQLNKEMVDDVIVGCAFPEAEQGFNMGRMISLMGLDTDQVPGMTVNRFCASGLEAISIASTKIHSGLADCIIAGGAESMSLVPMGGWKMSPNYNIATKYPTYYYSMGITAEVVADEYKISREDQDAFGYKSNMNAINAIKNDYFKEQIVPLKIEEIYVDENDKKQKREYVFDTDEGPRADASIDKMAQLKPVFKVKGSVTAGNSSQMSDGAAFVLVVSESFLKKLNLQPLARLVSYAVAGVPPRIMGIGPVNAIPKALKKGGLKENNINLIELNEAFAAQSLAVVRTLNLNPDNVNVNGGAIAMGHPLGCSGAKLTVQLLYELKRRKQKYGMVTMCVGSGQGAAGIFEMC